MSEDFLYCIVPKVKDTEQRRALFQAQIDRMTESDLLEIENDWGETDFTGLVNDYFNLEGRRDVGELCLEIVYYITGGMTGGDSPTEAFDIMCNIEMIPGLYMLLEQWANDDKLPSTTAP